jgi:hypothetical protein
MAESTCLHIQDSESGPIRVVELHWISVRIGRAAFCEVHLPDGRLADEACRLIRKGRTWSLVPSASGHGSILLEGRPLSGPCPLPFDVPFRLGPYCLTLRHDIAAEPDWELYPASEPIAAPAAAVVTGDEPVVTATANASTTAGRPGSDPDRWRARWKAAEAHLKARSARLGTGGHRGAPSIQPEALKEPDRPLYRPPSMSPPPVDRPAPAPSAPRIEPAWKPPRPDAQLKTPRLSPTHWPAPQPDVIPPASKAAPPTEEPEVARPGPAAELEPAGVGWAQPPDDDAEQPGGFTRAGTAREGVTDEARDGVAEVGARRAEPPGTSPAPPTRPQPPIVHHPVVNRSEVSQPEPPAVESLQLADVAAERPSAYADPGEWPSEFLAAALEEAPRFDDESSYSVGLVPDNVVATPPRPSIAGRPKRRARPADASPSAPTRPMDRGPRRRKPPRRSRREPDAAESASAEVAAAPAVDADLPSVRDILATHRNSPGPRPAVERPRRLNVAVPTVPLGPGQWVLPGWLAVPPAAITALGIGLLACVLSWWWAMDASNASVVTQRLLALDGSGRRRRLPEQIQPPGSRWIKTTAQHLAHWAVYQAGVGPDEAIPATEAVPTLTRALEISPLNPTARLAMSQLEGAGRDGPGRIRGLGLSRDSVSLAWSARRLMDSGKKEASLRLYRRALSAAADGGLSRSVTPRFAEDEAARRFYYLLPSEDAVRDIVAELATRDGLEFREWSKALPHHPIVLLATARILRERGNPEADALLDRILGDEWGGAEHGPTDPRLPAARGEAFMLRSRWPEAAEQYRLAIERVDNDLIRRSWWFNLADIAQRLDDEGQRQAALRAALAVNHSDDISRRVGLLQKAGDAKPRPRSGYGTARAN